MEQNPTKKVKNKADIDSDDETPAKRRVIDTHIHLLDGIGGVGPRLQNKFFQYMCKDLKDGVGMRQIWDEQRYRADWGKSSCEVEQTVYC